MAADNENPAGLNSGPAGFCLSCTQRREDHAMTTSENGTDVNHIRPVIQSALLNIHDQTDTAGMAAALERGVQEHIHDALGHIGTDDAGPHGQHIGIIVAAGHLRAEGIAAQGTADPLHLVGGDGDADSGGADHDAFLTAAVSHGHSRRLGEDGVVTALLAVTAAVQDVDALGGEICLDMLLEAVAAVVRSNRDHIPNSSSAGRAGIPDRRAHAIFKIGFALLLYFIFQDLARGQNSF